MLYLDNMLLWDGEFTPTRVPQISIDPEKWKSLSLEEKWIVVGKWKIRINIEPSGSGFKITAPAADANIVMSTMSGSVFVDQSMFEISSASSSANILGSASGCFDIRW